MSESCNRMKTNLKLQGQPCVACTKELALGDDAAQCNQCSAVHHASCWDASSGCATAGCVNAPLKRLDNVLPTETLRVGHKRCPTCTTEILQSDEICPVCNSIATADGLYHGPTSNAPGAVSSLVFGILGLLICGVIFGFVAISKSKSAKQLIASDPRYTGGGLATAGFVLGIVDIIAWGFIILSRLGG